MKKVLFCLSIIFCQLVGAQYSNTENLESQIIKLANSNLDAKHEEIYSLLKEYSNENGSKPSKSIKNIKTELSSFYENNGDKLMVTPEKVNLGFQEYLKALELNNNKRLRNKIKLYNNKYSKNVNVVFTNNNDFKFSKQLEDDFINYLNKSIYGYKFSLDSASNKEDLVINIIFNNLTVSHMVTPSTSSSLSSSKSNAVDTNSIINFNFKIDVSNDKGVFLDSFTSNYLISPNGFTVNDKMIFNDEILKYYDANFYDYMKQENFVNTQEIGFTKGLGGSSGFSANNISNTLRINDHKAKSFILSIILKNLKNELQLIF